MIRFICPACSRPLKIQEARAGTQGPCPGCGTVMQLPSLPVLVTTTVTAPAAGPATPGAEPQERTEELARPAAAPSGGEPPPSSTPRRSRAIWGATALLVVASGAAVWLLRDPLWRALGFESSPEPSSAAGPHEPSHSATPGAPVEEWQTSWDAFGQRLSDTLTGPVRPRPPEGANKTYSLQNANGETIWLVHSSDIPDTWEWTIEQTFAGKEIAWDVTIEKLAIEDNAVIVSFQREFNHPPAELRLLRDSLRHFYAVIPKTEQALQLIPSQRVRVHGKLDKADPLGGISLLYGVGPEAGKFAIYIKVQEARLTIRQ